MPWTNAVERYISGLASMVSFIALAYSIGQYNALLRRVVIVDVVASLLLIAAAAIHLGQ
ncbi:MAG: hypothetical protein ACREQ9_10235 [Candidatus Binatia bacterium]